MNEFVSHPRTLAPAGEFDIYRCNSLILQSLAGADLPPLGPQPSETFNGLAMESYPRVVLSPNFAPLLADIKVGGLVSSKGWATGDINCLGAVFIH